jgi:hypothetical protein
MRQNVLSVSSRNESVLEKVCSRHHIESLYLWSSLIFKDFPTKAAGQKKDKVCENEESRSRVARYLIARKFSLSYSLANPRSIASY